MRAGRAIKWLCIVAALSGAGASAYTWGPRLYARWFSEGEVSKRQEEARYTAAKRDDLRILIVEDGKLRAVKYHAVYPQLKGENRISWLIPEGTAAKKGEKVLEFDKKPREEVLRTKKADLETQKRQVTVAEETLKIQRSSSKASLRAAETKLHDTQVALRVYQNLEGPKRLNELEAAITDARAKHNAKIKELGEAQKRIDEQLFTDEQQRKVLDKDLLDTKNAVEMMAKAVETGVLQQKTYRRYDYPQNLTAKKQAVETAQLDLEKARVAATSEVNQKEQELAKVNDTIRNLTEQIAELETELKNCTLLAPADGMVLYGDPNRPYYMYREQGLRVGLEWYGSNTLMTIPDTSVFEVTIAIGEEYRGKVSEGAKAMITVEAIPGLTLEGELKKIEGLARNRVPWDQASPKVFDATVLPSQTDERMVSGMTTRVEIVAEVVPKALVVPLEAVFNENGTPVCYVRKGAGTERREVEPGKSNDHQVQILSGLVEGEQVDLTPQRSATAGQGGYGPGGKRPPATRPGATQPTTRSGATQPTTRLTTQAATQPATQATTQSATRPSSTQAATTQPATKA